MRVKDMFTAGFTETYGDVDVYDNVCEDLGVAYCGALLTKEGRSHFRNVLNLEVTLTQDPRYGYWEAVVDIDGDGWEGRLKRVKELFEGAAGYISETNYRKWFREEN